MPLFMPDDELARLSSDAASAVAEKADEYIRKLYGELDNVRAKADSASITAEQTCTLLEKNYNESSSSLNWHKERLRELETKITSLQEANKLVELYKESSEEWPRKAGELQKEVSTTNQKLEKEMEDIKQKLEKCEAEIEKSRKPDDLRRLPFSSFTRRADDSGTSNTLAESQELISQVPPGVSGTALAASLLCDGRSVLSEVEEKAGFVQEERGENDLVNKKLGDSEFEETNMDKSIMELKADLKRRQHEKIASRKEIYDLKKKAQTLKWMVILMDEEAAAEVYYDYYDPGRPLAVLLIRNGWSVPKVNEMYLAAVDASGLERRKEAYPSILKQVLSELEEKVGFVQEERGEYSEDSESEEMNMDKSITELKADLRRLEHENIDSQNKISFLQDQVWLGLRYGVGRAAEKLSFEEIKS